MTDDFIWMVTGLDVSLWFSPGLQFRCVAVTTPTRKRQLQFHGSAFWLDPLFIPKLSPAFFGHNLKLPSIFRGGGSLFGSFRALLLFPIDSATRMTGRLQVFPSVMYWKSSVKTEEAHLNCLSFRVFSICTGSSHPANTFFIFL